MPLPFKEASRHLKGDEAKWSIMGGMALVNGWFDSICLRRYRAFATMMVGNQLALGNAAGAYFYDVSGKYVSANPFFYSAMIVTFMAGVIFFRVFDHKHDFHPRNFAPLVLIVMIVHDVIDGIQVHIHCQASSQWLALPLAFVFGIQDAIMVKNEFASLPWCTTGNIVTVADGLVKRVLGTATDQERRKHFESLVLLSCTLTGAIAGGMYACWRLEMSGGCEGDYGMMLAAPVLGLLFWLHDMHTRPKSFKGRLNHSRFSMLADKLLDVDGPEESESLRGS
eukprot:TRINITY_DN49361_c0_g1_i1.p1 TRINITY_DN49361_c0_g1~~TRINITY_DN49361_c0_g1_i1.p1  ORF type:complete len:292 (+),score=52.79 TRINITY_DN49361_c0_g1_i1:36-878(+)